MRRAAGLLLVAKDLSESGASSLSYERAAMALRDAAQRVGDASAEARARTALAQVHTRAGRFAEADGEVRKAMELDTGDPWAACNAPLERGIVAFYRKAIEDAETYLHLALDHFRGDGNAAGEASALCNLSRVHLALGHTDSAIALVEEGIEIYDRLGSPLRLANGRYALGLALTAARRFGDALSQLTEAAAIFHENRQPLWEGVSHFRIAEVHMAAHRPTLAAAHAEQAITLRCIGGEWRRACVLTMLGKALQQLGQPDRAQACWREALSVHEALGSSEADEVRALLTPIAS